VIERVEGVGTELESASFLDAERFEERRVKILVSLAA
jgi:hypothetical protein